MTPSASFTVISGEAKEIFGITGSSSSLHDENPITKAVSVKMERPIL
jgi:hypothetical protein